ncbi:MAG TPA: molecular chaperone TorD family protein [Burkholderiales bacterium]|nr:molecular chaperone TorD family protein [Burkholderiales bacterium]
MLTAEEAGRAHLYALLGRLFYAPPDAALLRALATSGELDGAEGALKAAWRELAAGAAAADPEAVRYEYDRAFVGVGKAPVTLYTCAYSIRFTNEVPLVALREELAALGVARRPDANEPEDHIAALCEVMRHLIEQSDLQVQKRFFERWIRPTAGSLCAAISASAETAFYKHAAQLLNAVCSVEHTAFDMI